MKKEFAFSIVSLALPITCIALFVSSDCCFSAESGTFHSQTYGYFLSIPEGWTQIPDAVYFGYLYQPTSSDSNVKLTYDAAFQRSSAEKWFQTPYVMVQAIELKRQIDEDQFEQITKGVTGAKLTELMQERLSEDALDSLSEVTTGRAYLDRDNRLFWYDLSADVEGVGTVRCRRVGHFGWQAVIIVSFCDTARHWDESGSDRSLILNSFRFEPSAAYNDAHEKRNITLPSLILGGLKEIVLTVLFVVIALVVFFGRSKQKKVIFRSDKNK